VFCGLKRMQDAFGLLSESEKELESCTFRHLTICSSTEYYSDNHNASSFFCILGLFQFFLVISEIPPCLLSLVKPLRRANCECTGVDIFRKYITSLKHILPKSVAFLINISIFTGLRDLLLYFEFVVLILP